MTYLPFRSPRLRLTLASLACLLPLGSGWAADPTPAAQAQAQYRQDMAVCNSGRSHQPAATCRLEARNAMTEARRGALVNAPETYTQNARQRCLALEGVDRSACESRMRGEGRIDGSVNAGGILRESTTVIPAN
jgi:hypothetical protein